jgi:hypothetical protein
MKTEIMILATICILQLTACAMTPEQALLNQECRDQARKAIPIKRVYFNTIPDPSIGELAARSKYVEECERSKAEKPPNQ